LLNNIKIVGKYFYGQILEFGMMEVSCLCLGVDQRNKGDWVKIHRNGIF